jgi:hypothetical protein
MKGEKIKVHFWNPQKFSIGQIEVLFSPTLHFSAFQECNFIFSAYIGYRIIDISGIFLSNTCCSIIEQRVLDTNAGKQLSQATTDV